MKKSTVIIRLAVFILILIVFNMISSKLYFRLDFTQDKRYTLSNATQDILENLDDVITIKAYFSEDLPTQLIGNRQDFEDLLLEYENRSGGNIVYEFISPNGDDELEQEAQEAGIFPRNAQIVEEDQVQQLIVYMGAVLLKGESKEVIPLVEPGVHMEYALTTSIKKISVTDKPKVALIQGHGEPSLQEVAQLVQQLSVLYDVEEYTISDTDIPTYYKALAIINPSDTIAPGDFSRLDQFINQGGGVFVAYSNMNGDLSNGYLSEAGDIGIKSWLSTKGVQMGNQFVIDASSGSVTVQRQIQFGTMRQQIKFPYFPRINNFSDHPTTKGLENIMLPFVSSLSYTGSDSLVNYEPVMFSSELSGLASTPAYVDIEKRWQESDFNNPELPLAVTLDGPLGGTVNSKMVVIANGQYVINGNPPQQISENNVSFTSNAIDWISDDTGLIDLRTKGVSARPLDQIEDSTRNMLKYGNVLGPIVLILIYAGFRRQRNVAKRNKWREGSY